MTTIPLYLSSISSNSNSSLASTSTSTFSTAKSSSSPPPNSNLPPALPPKPKSLKSIQNNDNNQRLNLSSTNSYVLPPVLPKRDVISSSKSVRSSTSNTSTTSIPIKTTRNSTIPSSSSSLFLSSLTNNPTSEKLLKLSKGWSKKGKERLQEGWNLSKRNSVSIVNLATSVGSSSSKNDNYNRTSNPNGNSMSSELPGGIRLPCVVLGVKVPNKVGAAFGIPLAVAVERSRIKTSDISHKNRGPTNEEVEGEDARYWLPGIAFRCLEYLELWAEKGEEGLYRVPGSSHQIAQLRALFDSGEDIDLREIHPGDLDPHAVASVFKAWLREIPESLLSPALESKIDTLVMDSTGFSATSTQFLGSHLPDLSKMKDGKPPVALLEKLSNIFSQEMKGEQFYLLRAVCFHLARCEMRSDRTKMTLNNLRLILSPTLKLSPTFLLILIAERNIFFGKPNEAARRNNLDQGFSSPIISTPSSATSSVFPSNRSSSSTSRVPPPSFLQPISSDINELDEHQFQSRNSVTNPSPPHIWLKIDESVLESSPRQDNISSFTSTTPSTVTRTPIADRFVSPLLSSSSTFSDSSINYFDPLPTTATSVTTTSILDRSVSRGGRSIAGGSSGALNSYVLRDATSTTGHKLSSSATYSQSHFRKLSDVSNNSTSSLPYHSNSHPSHSHSHSHSHSTSHSFTQSQGHTTSEPIESILSPHRYSSESFMSKNGGDLTFEGEVAGEGGEYLRRFSRPVPSVSLPEGFGASTSGGKGTGKEEAEEEEGFGLLTFEERKKFFTR